MQENTALPETIGRYEVKSLLGSGAMGSVYLAEDPRIKRKLAVKVVKLDSIRSEAERKEYLARFQREAEVSGVLNHPGIVTIYDVGDSDLGPFLAMEFVAGQPLDHLIKADQSVPLKSKLQIAAGIAEALDHAHCHGIVHRDVKPGNVMISEDGRPKLMDFGIAKREDAHLTQTGTFLGTPSYASPEQIKEGHATERSDIFSFGVMVFELLSGNLPFPGSSINTILYRIVNEPPVEVKPPVVGLLPEGWRRIFSQVLAKDPANRYPTCTAFVRELVEAATELTQGERLELLGSLRVTGLGPMPPVLDRSHEATMFVPSEATAKRKKRRATLWAASGLLLALAVGAYFLFFRKGGGDVVQISSVPEEAHLIVDGKDMGLTPSSLPLKPGQKVILEHKGYLAKEFEYVAGNSAPKLELQPIVSKETIRSEPEGASVVLDEVKLDGSTPLVIEKWNQGQKHTLTLTKGDLVASKIFDIGEIPSQSYVLKSGSAPATAAAVGIDPGTPGTLVLSGGFPVHVKVDGKDMGEQKAGAKLQLAPGQHKVELASTRHFYKEARTLSISPGQAATLPLPGLAYLTVETFPGSGKIVVDGIVTDIESDGGTAIPVAKGAHVIGIQGKSAKQSVEINGNQTLKFRI